METILTRRGFLGRGIGLASLAATIPSFLAQAAEKSVGSAEGPVLVVIQLSGGNDGLNTVIPYADDAYYRARPTLAVAAKEVLRVDDHIGLHPALKPLMQQYEQGRLSIVQGVGYPNPDRSHFRSMEIWHSAVAAEFETSGWIGRLFDAQCAARSCEPTAGVCVDGQLSPAFTGNSGVGIALRDPEQFYRMTRLISEKPAQGTSGNGNLDFLRRTGMHAAVSAGELRQRARAAKSQISYPDSALAQQLRLTAKLIAGDLKCQVYYATLGGFDTHAGQERTHPQLLAEYAEAVGTFQRDLEQLGVADRVMTMTFSEFGRRVRENGSRGTDHGKAAPMFVMGRAVRPGLISKHPSLQQLDQGDLRFEIDFRSVYATMLAGWLGADATTVLRADYPRLGLLA